MRAELDRAAVPPRLHLAGSLTIAEAAAARAELLALLRTLPAGAVRLDLADVAEADGAGVQLLVAAAHSLRGAGHPPQWGPCSEPLRRVARAIGIELEAL